MRSIYGLTTTEQCNDLQLCVFYAPSGVCVLGLFLGNTYLLFHGKQGQEGQEGQLWLDAYCTTCATQLPILWYRRKTTSRTDGRTHQRVNGWREARTDGQTDGRTDGKIAWTKLFVETSKIHLLPW